MKRVKTVVEDHVAILAPGYESVTVPDLEIEIWHSEEHGVHQVFSGAAMKRIQDAIENRHPGYFEFGTTARKVYHKFFAFGEDKKPLFDHKHGMALVRDLLKFYPQELTV